MFKLKSGEPHRNIWTHVFIGHKNLKRFALQIDKKCSLSKSVLYDNLLIISMFTCLFAKYVSFMKPSMTISR